MTLFQLDRRIDPSTRACAGYLDALPKSMWIVGIAVGGRRRLRHFFDGDRLPHRRILADAADRPRRLFLVKFVVGLVVVLLVLDATIIAATWFSPIWGTDHSMNWAYIACFLPLHATMFAVAVAWTCILRRPVWGGMAAIATFALLNIALDWSAATRDFDPIQVYNHLGLASRTPGSPVDFTAHSYPLVAATMGLILLISVLIGWLALRRYDPRRQSG